MTRASAKNRGRSLGPSSKNSYDEEINAESYPFYRLIPVKNIALKQEALMNKYKSTTVIHPVIPSVTQLPVLNVIPTGQPNHYMIDFPPLINKQQPQQPQEHIEQVKEETNYKEQIEEQLEKIKQNEETIQSQLQQINNLQSQIQQLTETQNQHLHCYGYNSAVIQQQAPQIQQNCQTIYEQNVKIEEQRNELMGLQSQINYHQQMLGAFNTMIQNPHYFTQLMMSSMMTSMNASVQAHQ
jgi:hypothetical protein